MTDKKKNGQKPWYRELHEGMGQAVAERTILRKISHKDGHTLSLDEVAAGNESWRWETWGDVAERVALGNSLLEPREEKRAKEYEILRKHLGNATMLMSGRHLQHGDKTQPGRGIECFTNCATAATSFSLFLLLLHGSGVGRCYDEDMMLVNWDHAPTLRCVLDESHPDFDYSAHESVRDAKHKYCEGRQGRIQRGVLPDGFGNLVEYGRDILWYTLPDTREGWSKALEIWENAAFEKVHKDKMLILDFSEVREKGAPIKGMQNRPASGPVPLMNAFMKGATIKGSNLPRWKQATYIDHYFAECVLVGGARRCLPAETLVKLVDGCKPIEKVQVGDVVETVAGIGKVSAFFDQGIQETVFIEHEFGKFECTSNHKVAVFDSIHGWVFKAAGEVVPGDRLVFDRSGWDYPRTQDLKLPSYELTAKQKSKRNTTGLELIIPELDEDVAWLLGYIHGNGYVELTKDGHGRIRIAVPVDVEYTGIPEKLSRIISRFNTRPTVQPKEGEGYIEVVAHNVQLATYLYEHFKKPNTAIEIPDYIRENTRGIRWSYLAGLFDADGCSKNRPLNLCSTVYDTLARGVTELCLSLGVLPHWRFETERGENWQDLISVHIKGMENLEAITEGFSAQSLKFDKSLQFSIHTFSFPTEMVREEYKGHWITPNANQPTHRMSVRGGVQFEALPVPVLKVVSSGRSVATYDIEVEGIHQFTADGLVVHNSARMSTKTWRDLDVLEFITIKRPIEYLNLQWQEIIAYRKAQTVVPFGFLWSSNNSVTVDGEFWELLSIKKNHGDFMAEDAQHARRVFRAITEASYADGTGEPALINVHKLTQNNIGLDKLEENGWIGSKRYQVNEDTEILMHRLVRKVKRKKYKYIVNPCSEIVLLLLGGYCTLGDVVPFHADSLEEAEEAFRATTRALIRTNLMDSLYHREVKRTNRIGVGLTGIHEFAWKFFKLGFKDLVNEEKSKDFWFALSRFHWAVRDEAERYCKELNVTMPHTTVTVKPSGTVSKLWGLTEGWHLPSMAWYLRWVQFRNDDPLVAIYSARGYPTRQLKSYEGTTIVGFPTAPKITELGLGDKLITAAEAQPEEQYKWLQLCEKYWLQGYDGVGYPQPDLSNNCSYTLKYSPDKVDFQQFRAMMKKYQPTIKCCAVMPQTKATSYEYQPEQPTSKVEYEEAMRHITEEMAEDIDKVHIGCALGGACPVDFDEGAKELSTSVIGS